jgi:peptidyl-prolyl cis-trans isomerase B (cyclophilin B)
MRGGCPRNDGSGSPERTTFAQNTVKIPHEKGTISMVTRPTRLGSKEIGSIFFICRKPHPEWDEDHVPIGKIVAGEEVLDKLEGGSLRPVIRKASVVTGDKAPPSLAGAAAAPAAAANPKAAADAKQPLPPRGLPTAKVKTAKGEFAVELYEEDAPNTVANFIKLVEQGFFNPDPAAQKKEQTIYAAYPGTALITGSPTNDDQGGPGYRIANEAADNKKSHLKGTLTMLLETDPASGNPVPDSAGSQFMICLQDLPSWNGLYTPFGKVTEGAEVLDKLAQGDKIESITITSKRNRPYEVRKVNTGNVSFGNR